MKSNNYKLRTIFATQESQNIKSATNKIKKILDANYKTSK